MDAFIGEIRPFAFNYVPQGWLECNGQSLPVSQNAALYSIIGNTYGGDTTSFNLPDLRGHAAVGAGDAPTLSAWKLGEAAGVESVTLSANQIPGHNHNVVIQRISAANAPGNTTSAPVANQSWLSRPVQTSGTPTTAASFSLASGGVPDTMLYPTTVGVTGGGQAHENRQPYLALLYCICTDGTYPPHP